MRFNNFSSYMRATYGGNLEKICLDGAFTCPNRDGTRSRGGCIFCGERGAGDHIEGRVDIKEQLKIFEHGILKNIHDDMDCLEDLAQLV